VEKVVTEALLNEFMLTTSVSETHPVEESEAGNRAQLRRLAKPAIHSLPLCWRVWKRCCTKFFSNSCRVMSTRSHFTKAKLYSQIAQQATGRCTSRQSTSIYIALDLEKSQLTEMNCRTLSASEMQDVYLAKKDTGERCRRRRYGADELQRGREVCQVWT
jgi:nitric oxide synthase oxygenase domain/subunit